MENQPAAAAPSKEAQDTEKQQRKSKERKERKEKSNRKEKKSRDKKEKKESSRKPKDDRVHRAQSFAVPVESALPLGHALVEHFLTRVDPSLKEAEATLRRIRESLGVQEDDDIAALLGSLSAQDAFTVRLEILKSKLSTTETIVQMFVEEDRSRRTSDAPAMERRESAIRALAGSRSSSNQRLIEKKLSSQNQPHAAGEPYDSMPVTKAPSPLANSQDYRQPIPPPAVAAAKQGDARKGTNYTAMPSRTAASPSPPSTSAPHPQSGSAESGIEPTHLVKPSQVASGKGAGRFQGRSLSRRTAELYAQYGDRVEQSS